LKSFRCRSRGAKRLVEGWKEIGGRKRGSSRRGRGGVDDGNEEEVVLMMVMMMSRMVVRVNRMRLREEVLYGLGTGCKLS